MLDVANSDNKQTSGSVQILIIPLVILGITVSDNTNRIDNIIGVSLYNIDLERDLIGTTIPAIAVSINNLKLWCFLIWLVTMGVSHRADIIAGISFRNDIGVCYTGLITTGVSHLNLINSLGLL